MGDGSVSAVVPSDKFKVVVAESRIPDRTSAPRETNGVYIDGYILCIEI